MDQSLLLERLKSSKLFSLLSVEKQEELIAGLEKASPEMLDAVAKNFDEKENKVNDLQKEIQELEGEDEESKFKKKADEMKIFKQRREKEKAESDVMADEILKILDTDSNKEVAGPEPAKKKRFGIF